MFDSIILLSCILLTILILCLTKYIHSIQTNKKHLFVKEKINLCLRCNHICHLIHNCDYTIKGVKCCQCNHYHENSTFSNQGGHTSCTEKTRIFINNEVRYIICQCKTCRCFFCDKTELYCECDRCECLKCKPLEKKYIWLLYVINTLMIICLITMSSSYFAVSGRNIQRMDERVINTLSSCGITVICVLFLMFILLCIALIYYFEKTRFILINKRTL
jgi:hypothetical protein